MTTHKYRVPSTSALVAFESAARHCNFSRAAEDLNTSQSAISRHVADLEVRLGTKLFERHRNRLNLTEAGGHLYRAVVAGLETIQSATATVQSWSGHGQVTIACTHEISHLFLMPRFERLQQMLGADVQVKIMTCEYDVLENSLDPRIDVMFSYQRIGPINENSAVVFNEAIQPVCSPAFVEKNRSILRKIGVTWSSLPFLQLTKQNKGWATWDDWFDRVGLVDFRPKYLPFDNYVYLLEAAVTGRGIALGWRNLIDRYLATGALVLLGDRMIESDRALFAKLTPRGRGRSEARLCLEFLRSAADGCSC